MSKATADATARGGGALKTAAGGRDRRGRNNTHGEWELDDEIVAIAQALTGLKEKSSLVPEALKALIERESARGLAALGGSEPEIELAPRRRPVRAES